MEYALVAIGGYALIALTYSFLQTEWPDQYFSISDTVSREEGAVKQAAVEIGRKVVNHAVDRF